MGRTKGTKNRVGHKAGGARKGAGRKRKPTTEKIVEADSTEEDQQPIAGPSSLPENHVDANQSHPALRPYLNLPHHVPLVVTRVGAPPSAILRLCPSTWSSDPVVSDPITSVDETSTLETRRFQLPSPPFPVSDDHFLEPTPSGENSSKPCTFLENSQETSVSSPAPPHHIEMEQQFEPSEGPHDPVTEPSTPDNSDLPRAPSLPTRAALQRPPLANIAPSPSSQRQQQSAWTFPYPLPTVMSSPYHQLSHISSNKRRRRRCAVCVQLGEEEASYDCPGRGDRTRCALSQKKIREGNSESPAQTIQKANRNKKRRDPRPEDVSGAQSSRNPAAVSQNNSNSSRDVVPSGFVKPILPPVPPGYVALVPYGHPLAVQTEQQFVLSSGESSQRRARRCMVCVTLGKDGTQCPGRGNRTLCPDHDLATDVPALRKWQPAGEELDDKQD